MFKTKKIHIEKNFTRHLDALKKIPLREEFLTKEVGKGKKVLDLGCMDGYFASILKQNQNHVIGIDINPKALSIAKEKGIDVLEHNLEEPLPFPPSFFDVIIAYEIIEHIYDTTQIIKECYRVLKPKGFILISTPNLNSIPNRLRILFGFPIPTLGYHPDTFCGDHIRIFNKGTLSKLLQKNGFKPTKWIGISLLPYPLRQIFKKLPTLSDILLVKAVKP